MPRPKNSNSSVEAESRDSKDNWIYCAEGQSWRVDDFVKVIASSPNLKDSLRHRERSSTANNLDQRILTKAGCVYGKGGETKSARTKHSPSKMIRQGAVFDDEGDNSSRYVTGFQNQVSSCL